MKLKYLIEASCTISQDSGDNSPIESIINAELACPGKRKSGASAAAALPINEEQIKVHKP